MATYGSDLATQWPASLVGVGPEVLSDKAPFNAIKFFIGDIVSNSCNYP